MARTKQRASWIVLLLCGAAILSAIWVHKRPHQDEFTRLMTRGNGYLEREDATNAIALYQEALKLAPESLEAHLNLANAYLLAGENQKAIEESNQALGLDHDSGAAYYLQGLAYLHANQPQQAIQAFQQSQKIDPAVTPLNFQLGLAQAKLGQTEDAISTFETMLQFEPEHPSAHYQLSRLYQQAGRADEAAKEMQRHQQVLAKTKQPPAARALEVCKYTQPQIAFELEQPDRNGVRVRFADATASTFGGHAADYRGPLAVLDYNHDGRNSLFVVQGPNGFRLLINKAGRFEPLGELLPVAAKARYRKSLVGDINNDRFEDVVVLGEQTSHAFRFATNGQAREITKAAGLEGLKARDGLLADLDFTGRLDLLTVSPGGQGIRYYRNLGNFYFQENTTNSGLPSTLADAQQVMVEDWNNEDLPGVFVARAGKAPAYFAKQRAGSFEQTNSTADWPQGDILASGDLNNDLRADVVIAGSNELTIVFGGLKERARIPVHGVQLKGILLVDYDNDGWLDIIGYGHGLRVWRNRRKAGFEDVTAVVGLDRIGPVDGLAAADFDNDGDTDLILSSTNGLQFWRNDGANANKQLKLRLVGNRSNASGIGVRVELTSGRWRTLRSLQQLPFEIGVGKHDKIDALKTRWFDLTTTAVDVPVQPQQQLAMVELTVPAGSCPYLYAWNGKRFHFVTDILGAAPLGLPMAQGRYIDADPEEFLALGDEPTFQPTNGNYEVRITEELREVLYLDQAKLVVADHPAGTMVLPTSKLRARKPFPRHELWTVRPLTAPLHAIRSDGLDVSEALARVDNQMISPVHLREPQLRGLAEPFAVTLDFGELPRNRPLVLALTGWLRFGGGMANIAASLDPNLPFPFPALEAELPDGSWQSIATEVGAPAGKTKTILVDLESKLPAGARRLRLTTAFEIHWDCALLCEKMAADQNHTTEVAADRADLHWHGFGEFEPLPDFLPLTPRYDQAQSVPPWSRTPAGWCTRYGPVGDLLRNKDNVLALLNGGDEVALSFDAARLPPKTEGFTRDFFLYVVGWDKDADFHVGQGWRVEPLPFGGMDDQKYDKFGQPGGVADGWIQRYNTRWVGPMVLRRTSVSPPDHH